MENTKVFKEIVSDDKPIDSKKIEEPINFIPTFKIIFSAHPLPRLKEVSNGK